MPSPFPGMDPYLENPALWPDVHNGLISEIQASLNLNLRPRYVARVELRVYVSEDDDPGRRALVPDVRVEETESLHRVGVRNGSATLTEPVTITLIDDEIEEYYIAIKLADSNKLVTIIEVLSPSNKILGSSGRKSFMQKRREILESNVHWVEIDLLRDGAPTVGDPPLKPCDYRVIVSRAGNRFDAKCWPFWIRQALPVIGIPLRGKDPEVALDLSAVLKSVYERAAYDLSVDYRKPPVPPLKGQDATWAKQVIRKR